jgi:hypothetical protein
MCRDLLEDRVEVEIMWIPVHVGLEGNEIVDKRGQHTALNGAIFERPLPTVDFQGLAESVLLREWQEKKNATDTGRFTHFILSKVFLRPWFEGQREDMKFFTVSRIMFGRCTARSHLSRFSATTGLQLDIGQSPRKTIMGQIYKKKIKTQQILDYCNIF